MWTWKADTPARVPAGARISAGKSGNVARSLPNNADDVVKRSPASCMPSPESPANRMTTRSIRWGDFGSMVVSDTLLLFVLLYRARRRTARRRLRAPGPARRSSGHADAPRARGGSPLTLLPHTGRTGHTATGSGHGHLYVEVDVLDGVDQCGALVGRPLERLAAHDEAGATGPLVDDGGAHGLGQIVGALGLTARVDQGDPSGVAVDDLPAGQVDRVVGGELAVDQGVGLAELQGVVAAVVLRLLLLDDVGLDGHAEVVGLAGQVGRQRVVGLLGLEGRVAEIGPEDGEEAELVSAGEGVTDLLDLAVGLI